MFQKTITKLKNFFLFYFGFLFSRVKKLWESHIYQAEQGDSAAVCRSLFTIGTEPIFLRQKFEDFSIQSPEFFII